MKLDKYTLKYMATRIRDLPYVKMRSGDEFDTLGKTHRDVVLDLFWEELDNLSGDVK